jgi:hypothetical protein
VHYRNLFILSRAIIAAGGEIHLVTGEFGIKLEEQLKVMEWFDPSISVYDHPMLKHLGKLYSLTELFKKNLKMAFGIKQRRLL